jgi:hypothetical protein
MGKDGMLVVVLEGIASVARVALLHGQKANNLKKSQAYFNYADSK